MVGVIKKDSPLSETEEISLSKQVWVVEYWYMRESSHAKHPNQTTIPLHPLYTTISNSIKSKFKLVEGMEVNFEIKEDYAIIHGINCN